MDEKEAIIVINIMMSADGECFACAAILLNSFVQSFPEFSELTKEMYKSLFKRELE
jgi:hypothetical protein